MIRQLLILSVLMLPGLSWAQSCQSGGQRILPPGSPNPACQDGCWYYDTGSTAGLGVCFGDPNCDYGDPVYSNSGESCALTGGGGGTGAGGCDSPPSCDGTSLDCFTVIQMYEARCSAESIEESIRGGVSGGGSCDSPVECDSGTYACEMARQQHATRCALSDSLDDLQAHIDDTFSGSGDPGSGDPDLGVSALTDALVSQGQSIDDLSAALADFDPAGDPALVSSELGDELGGHGAALDQLPTYSLDVSDLLTPYTPGACVSDLVIPLPFLSGDLTVPFSRWCGLIALLGAFIHLGAALTAVRMVLV